MVELLGLKDVAIFAGIRAGTGVPQASAARRQASPPWSKMWTRSCATFPRTPGSRCANMIVLAHSVGAVSVATWVHDYAPPIRAMILATAAFRVKLYVPLAVPALRLKQKALRARLREELRESEDAHARSRAGRALRRRSAHFSPDRGQHSARSARHLRQRLLADAGAINVPTLMLGAGSRLGR